MIRSINDEEFGPFGEYSIKMIDFIFPKLYQKIIIVSPSFCNLCTSNVSPQFSRGDFAVFSSAGDGGFLNNFTHLQASQDIEMSLECHRYEHAILASSDLSILTAWAQGEYAVMAFRGTLLDEFGEWLACMRDMGVVRQIPKVR